MSALNPFAPFFPFAEPGPRWFSIPAHRPFMDDLAAGVLAALGDAPPETLSDAIVLLPNRRAARAFTEALARQSPDRPVLLPQVRPLGDLEEDETPFAPGDLGLDLPPAISGLRRRFEMARMIVEDFSPGLSPLRALELADSLGGFLDSCQLEEVPDLHRVADLVEGDLAEHWRDSARFLGLAVAAWPRRLEALGLVDPAWRRTRLLRLLAERWRDSPPEQPVIAAGSTGSVPAAADVLAAVAAAPQGCVVLPGLDLGLADTAWDRIDEQHPQAALKRLLDRHGAAREQVRPWFQPSGPVRQSALDRERLIHEALRPAEATDDWRREIAGIRARAAGEGRADDPIAAGLEGLSILNLPAEEAAATAIALMMRETLETPQRTCALVTPDLDLARRVEARLERWGVRPDSSTGLALARMPLGVLVDLAARLMADPTRPQTLLALLKHPALRAGAEAADAAETLEAEALRGPPPADWAALHTRLDRAAGPNSRGQTPPDWKLARLALARARLTELQAAVDAARRVFASEAPLPETPLPEAPLDAAARALVTLIETLTSAAVWTGPDGEGAAALLSSLIEGGAALGAIGPEDFAELVHGLIRDETVRVGGATHGRLRILGAIEGRLARADRMILAGLEEGVWPRPAPVDPFLSRPMKQALGLPPPERRLGQTAQDFVQAACADEAILVHCDRRGGQPAVRSRWLWRLEMITRGAHGEATPVALVPPAHAADWVRALDAPPPGPPLYAPRPMPRPPVERRPRSLYVTRIERWVRDPYAIYARHILGLEAMERPGASAEALARGNAVHKAIERLTLSWPDALPDDCAGEIEALLLEELHAHGFTPAAMAREAPLARNCAHWLTAFEQRRRARGVDILVEQQGVMTFQAPAGPFTVKAYADRIELGETGGAVLDFKTGAAPSAKQVKSGLAPQLTLTGAILAAGGFDATNGPVTPEELTYVRVVGRTVAGEETVRASGPEAAALVETTLEGLKRRVALFDDPATPYASWAAPQFIGRFAGDYDHLARLWEWHVIGGDGEEGE